MITCRQQPIRNRHPTLREKSSGMSGVATAVTAVVTRPRNERGKCFCLSVVWVVLPSVNCSNLGLRGQRLVFFI